MTNLVPFNDIEDIINVFPPDTRKYIEAEIIDAATQGDVDKFQAIYELALKFQEQQIKAAEEIIKAQLLAANQITENLQKNGAAVGEVHISFGGINFNNALTDNRHYQKKESTTTNNDNSNVPGVIVFLLLGLVILSSAMSTPNPNTNNKDVPTPPKVEQKNRK